MKKWLVLAAFTAVLTACSSSGDDPKTSSAASSAADENAQDRYAILKEAALSDALLDLEDVPVGYSEDAEEPPSNDKTFCDYKVPHEVTARVSTSFSKGGGLSLQYSSVGIREYADATQASESFQKLVQTLKSCKSETYEGSKLKYSRMSVPEVGDGSTGVRIDSDDESAVLQTFAVVGPSLISAGSAGLTDVDVDQVFDLLRAQVEKYSGAAKN